jgi:predicted ferric reductase
VHRLITAWVTHRPIEKSVAVYATPMLSNMKQSAKKTRELCSRGLIPIFIKNIGGDGFKILHRITYRYFILGIFDIHMMNN